MNTITARYIDVPEDKMIEIGNAALAGLARILEVSGDEESFSANPMTAEGRAKRESMAALRAVIMREIMSLTKLFPASGTAFLPDYDEDREFPCSVIRDDVKIAERADEYGAVWCRDAATNARIAAGKHEIKLSDYPEAACHMAYSWIADKVNYSVAK